MHKASCANGLVLAVALTIVSTPGVAAFAPRADAQQGQDQQQREALKHYRAGTQLSYGEKWDEAVEEFNQAIKLNPLLTIAHYGLGQAYMALKRYQEAIRAFTGAREASGRIAALGERDRATADRMRDDQLRELRESLDQVRSGQMKVADNQTVTLRLESRIQELERGRQRDTSALESPPEISLSLGSAYFHTGALADAEREYRAAIQVRPRFGEAHNNLAVVLMMTNRISEAKAEVKLAEKAGYRVNPQFKKDLAAK
jgi:tetratricopeptide (TPR) repeat protein